MSRRLFPIRSEKTGSIQWLNKKEIEENYMLIPCLDSVGTKGRENILYHLFQGYSNTNNMI